MQQNTPHPPRIDPKRRQTIDPKKKQFATPLHPHQHYPSRLNFYATPPVADIPLESFEEWAIHRLKVLSELETCTFRNRTPDETAAHMRPVLEKHLPLAQNSSRSPVLQDERRKDHYSHFILRLAFAGTEDLRRRFARLETALFRLRMASNDARDRQDFFDSLQLPWSTPSAQERAALRDDLLAVNPATKRSDDDQQAYFKLPWEHVPDLVEHRRVLLRAGTAYVPAREQPAMVAAEFSRRLDAALELAARALPRLDEDDRLSPILTHLSQNLAAPGSSWDAGEGGEGALPGAEITARSIDALAPHFPPCMRNLHGSLRRDGHLKHFSRLQYTLFLKGVGLSLEECLLFWRTAFRAKTDDEFNKEYRYNVRHAYGDVGGDANRRGRGYSPYSCQKLLTEALPGPGQNHGCPYRTFSADNLVELLAGMGVREGEVLRGVREDVGRQRYHVACNRVFEWAHRGEIRRVKEEGTWSQAELDTIDHPNMYFKRSWLLSQVGKDGGQGGAARRDIRMED